MREASGRASELVVRRSCSEPRQEQRGGYAGTPPTRGRNGARCSFSSSSLTCDRRHIPAPPQSPLQKRLTVRGSSWTIDEPFDFCAAIDADPDQLDEEASGFAWHEAASGSPPAGRARFLRVRPPFPRRFEASSKAKRARNGPPRQPGRVQHSLPESLARVRAWGWVAAQQRPRIPVRGRCGASRGLYAPQLPRAGGISVRCCRSVRGTDLQCGSIGRHGFT